MTLDSNSFNYDTMIWQLNDGSGWFDIPVTSTSFQDINTPNLKITNVQLADDGLLLKAKFYRDDYVCSAWESEQVLLKVNNLPEVWLHGQVSSYNVMMIQMVFLYLIFGR